MEDQRAWDVIVVGAGLAGLSAAIYLGRALRETLVIDDQHSLAVWEPEVQNYLGFPEAIAGKELLRRGQRQAEQYGARFAVDTISVARNDRGRFTLRGRSKSYEARKLLLATGLYHLPPDIPGVDQCLGKSMFFCKDCDAYRVRGKRIAIVGGNNETVEYALAMLLYSPCIIVATNGKAQTWDEKHATWLTEYGVPIVKEKVEEVQHQCGRVFSLTFLGGAEFAVDSIFTTRGDVYHNRLARGLGAELDDEGQILIDARSRTSVPGLYAAGCITSANCQMIIAAGQGAIAAQAINRDLFEESLSNHSLRRFREDQLETEQTVPEVLQ